MTPRKTHLRAAADGETPPPKAPPKSVTEAAEGGSHRELLVAMRTRIAMAVEDVTTPARDLAALTKRLADVAREIEALDAKAAQEASEDARRTTDEAFDEAAI